MPRTGPTLCHPQNWLCRFDAQLSSRHLALNYLWATLMETTHTLLPKNTYTRNSRRLQSSIPPTATWLSLNYGEHNPSHVRRHALPSQPSQPSHKSISSPQRLFTHNLSTSPAAQTQTTFSMLQIKTIPKTHFDYRHFTTSSTFIYS